MYQTKLSAKGQVVLPSALRRRFDWEVGLTLEVIPLADGVTLRAVRARETLPDNDVFDEIGSIRPNMGEMVTDDDMHDLVVAEAVKRHNFWR